MKKRCIAIVLAMLMLVSMLAGCGNQEPTQPNVPDGGNNSSEPQNGNTEKEPVELTIWVASETSDEWSDAWEKQFLAEHPWITLNKVIRAGDAGNEFYQAVASGTAPDLVGCSFAKMNAYMATGILEPLNRYVEEWDEWGGFQKEYIDMLSRDGNVYGIPVQVAPMLFAYNKALFAKAGISEPPATWDDALAAAKKINDPDNQIIGYSTLTSADTEWFFQYYVWQAGGDLTVERDDGTAELTFTDPAVIKAAEYYQQLKSEGVLQSDLSLAFTDMVTQFGLGKIGMMPFAGDWVSMALAAGMSLDDLGLCLPPAGPSGKTATAISGNCYVINSRIDDAKKDAAWEYISFYTSKAFLASYFELLNSFGIISLISLPRDDIKIGDYLTIPEEYETVLEGVKSVGRLEFYGKGDFGSYVDRAVQNILIDLNADPGKAFADAQALCEKEALAAFNEANKR